MVVAYFNRVLEHNGVVNYFEGLALEDILPISLHLGWLPTRGGRAHAPLEPAQARYGAAAGAGAIEPPIMTQAPSTRRPARLARRVVGARL